MANLLANSGSSSHFPPACYRERRPMLVAEEVNKMKMKVEEVEELEV